MLPGVAAGGLKAACHSSPPPAAAAAACLLHNATPVRAQFCTSSRLHMWDPLIINQKYINGALEVLVLHNARLFSQFCTLQFYLKQYCSVRFLGASLAPFYLYNSQNTSREPRKIMKVYVCSVSSKLHKRQ